VRVGGQFHMADTADTWRTRFPLDEMVRGAGRAVYRYKGLYAASTYEVPGTAAQLNLSCHSAEGVRWLGQLRGTSFQGSSLSVRTSPGNPSTRSARMLRMTSDVPPSMELALTRRNILRGSGFDIPTSSGRIMG
jgi:hypothetical protein